MTKRKLSVLMPVYNAEAWVGQAIRSILCQTWTDFTLIVLDDGSTDESYQVLTKLAEQDSRVKVHQLEQNAGVYNARRQLIHMADSEYVAWMDADDLCHPDRFRQQLQFLENHSDYCAVGSGYSKQYQGRLKRRFVFKTDRWIRKFPHVCCASLMIRRTALLSLDYESADEYGGEDYYLLAQLARVGKIANLKAPLYLYRFQQHESVSTRYGRKVSALVNIRSMLYFKGESIQTPLDEKVIVQAVERVLRCGPRLSNTALMFHYSNYLCDVKGWKRGVVKLILDFPTQALTSACLMGYLFGRRKLAPLYSEDVGIEEKEDA